MINLPLNSWFPAGIHNRLWQRGGALACDSRLWLMFNHLVRPECYDPTDGTKYQRIPMLG